MASLGALADALPRSTSKETRRVAGAFLRGKASKGSCTVGPMRDCHVQTNGRELTVRGKVIARRAAPNTDTIEVCLNPRATAEERKAAGVVMRGLKAGIGVRESRDHVAKMTGRKGRAGTAWPGCVQVKVPAKLRKKAAAAITKGIASSIGPATAPKKGAKRGKRK